MTRKRGAFTLLELVVAMTIAGLVVVTAAVGLRVSISSLQRGNAETDRLSRLKAISYGLRVELASVYPLPPVSSPTTPFSYGYPVHEILTREEALRNPFFGGSDEIQFVTSRVISAGVGSPGLHRVRYLVRTEDDVEDEPPGLYKEVSPYFGAKAEERMAEANEERPGGAEFLLDPEVVGMSVEYLNPAAEEAAAASEAEEETEGEDEMYKLGDGSEWVPEVPEVIRVTLDYGDEQVCITAQTGAKCGPGAEEL